jgi:RHS repeat-associated protein
MAFTPLSYAAKANNTIHFDPPPNQPLNAGSVGISAYPDSETSVRFSTDTPSVCSISNIVYNFSTTTATVSLLSKGTCSINANASGNIDFNAPPQLNRQFAVLDPTLTPQSISFGAISDKIYPGSFGISATATSGLPVTFYSNRPSICLVSGSTVTLSAPGSCGIVANQDGNATFSAATPVIQTFNITLTPQSISFGTIATQVFPGSIGLSASATSGLPITFFSNTATTCSVSGTTLTLLSSGTCSVVAVQQGNSNYAPASSVTQSFTILRSQSISFNSIGTQTYPGSIGVSASATSGLQVSFSSSTPSICTVSSGTVTLRGPGTCTIVASQAGGGSYAAAGNVSQSFSVRLSDQSISFGAIGDQSYPGSTGVSATASSGLPVSYSSSTPGVCSASGSVVNFNGGGTCVIVASQAGNSYYNAAPQVAQSFRIMRTQSITFSPISNKIIGSAPFSVSATASSGLAVSLSSGSASVCSISGATVTLQGLGTCVLFASQGGDGNYNAAATVQQNFSVTAASQTVTFPALPATVIVGAAPVSLAASASSGLVVTYASSTPAICAVSGNLLTAITSGTCTIVASQAGNANFGAAQTSQSTQIKANSAAFVSQQIKANMDPGGTYTAKVTMQNDGTSTWPANGIYFLGSQKDQDNTIWGLKRVVLSADVLPGGSYTFTIPVTAPAAAGAYHFQWRMVQEGVQWFGKYSDDVVVIVGAISGQAQVMLSASPTNIRVPTGAKGNIAFTGSSTGTAQILKLELFKDTGAGFEVQPVWTVDGSAAVQDFSYTYAALSATYRFKLRSTDIAQNVSESAPVIVNVTDSALLGTTYGVRGNVGGAAQVYGWVCQVAAQQSVGYSIYLDAPGALGGTLLTTGTADVSTEIDNLSVQTQCQTPGVPHHFVVDVSSYAADYAGRPFYVQAQGTGNGVIVLPCEDNRCTIPGSLRIGLTTPTDGDRYIGPATVFARAAVANGEAYDEVAININGEWLTTQPDAEQNTFYAKKAAIASRTAPYLVYAKVRKGNSIIYSAQKAIYVDPATGVTLNVNSPAAQGTIVVLTPTTLSATASLSTGSTAVISSVKFYSNGQLITAATNSNNVWSATWSAPQIGPVDITARAFDDSGRLLADSQPVRITVTATAGAAVPASPIPVAVDVTVPHLSNDDAGTLAGDLSVGSDGVAKYSVPIVVPPGTAGFEPHLSLDYSSSGTNGPLGLGWSLGGLSSIQRCGKTIAQDQVNNRINFSNTDRLCLDGQRLVLINLAMSDENYWASSAEYRTEVESFSRIKTQIDGNGQRSFKVETKDGRVMSYGATDSSYVKAVISTVNSGLAAPQPLAKSGAQSWAVDSIKDKSGNFIQITYTQNSETGEHLPSVVRYGGNGLPAHAAVQFSYVDRADAWKKYIDESRNDLRSRLSHVRTYVGADLSGALSTATIVRDYVLGYEQSPTSGRSLLNSVQACDKLISVGSDISAKDCLPATVFAWGKPDPSKTAGFESKGIWAGGPSLTTFYNAGSSTVSANHPDYFAFSDFENSGYTDILEKRVRGFGEPLYEANGLPLGTLKSQYRYFHNTGIGFAEYKYQLSTAEPFVVLETGDFDGDGFLDLLVTTSGSESGYAKICLSPFSKASLGTPESTLSFDCEAGKAYPAVGGNGNRAMPYVVDVLGDGRSAHYSTNISGIATVCIQGGCQTVSNPPTALTMISPNDTGPEYSQNQYTRLNQIVDFSGVGKPYDVRWTRVNYVLTSQDGAQTINDPHFENLTPAVVLNSFNAPGASVTGDMATYAYPTFPTPPKNSFYLPYLFDRDTDMGSIAADFNGSGYNSVAFGYLALNWDATNSYYSYGKAEMTLCMSTGRALDCGVRNKYSGERYVSVRSINNFVGDGQPTILADVLSYVPGKKPQPSGALTMCRVMGDDTTGGTGTNDANMVCDPWAGFTMPVKGSDNVADNVFFLDMMGTGRTQIVQYHSGKFDATNNWQKDDRWEVFAPIDVAPEGQALDRIYQVTNGLGAVSTLEYADALTAAIVTRSSRASLKYPMRNVPRVGKIVSRLSVGNGFGGGQAVAKQTSYLYEDDAVDVQGRGSQGFAKVIVTDELSGIVTSSTYSQTWPLSGMELTKTVVSAGGVTMVDSANTLNLASLTPASNGQLVYYPYVEKNVTTRKDLKGGLFGSMTTTNTYDDKWGNLTQQVEEYDNHAFATTTVTTYLNSSDGWIIGKPLSVSTTKTDAANNTITRQVTFDYDSVTGLLKTSTQMPGVSALESVITYDRSGNSFGLVNKTTQTWMNPIINATRLAAAKQTRTLSEIVYEKNGRFPQLSKNALGQTETYTYDSATGARKSVKDINKLSTIYTLDGFGRISQELRHDGSQIRSYTKQCDSECPAGAAMANVMDVFHLDSDGITSSRMSVPKIIYYDNAGHSLGTLTWGFNGKKIVQSQHYDEQGRLNGIDRPHFEGDAVYSQQTNVYDDLNRITLSWTQDEGNKAANQTTTFSGLDITKSNSKLYKRIYHYYANGMLASVKDENSGITSFEYDAFGNLTKTTDPEGNVVTVGYDVLGRKTDLRDPDLGWVHYDVDPLGRTWRQISANQRQVNQSTSMDFDDLDRMTVRYEPDLESHWLYDGSTNGKGIGQLAEAYTMAGTKKDYQRLLSYDDLGRNNQTKQILTDGTYVNSIVYDSWNRPLTQQYQRNSDNIKTFGYRYNNYGYQYQVLRGDLVLSEIRGVDAENHTSEALLGNGLRDVHGYSASSGRVQSNQLTNNANSALLQQSFIYDVLGNVLQNGLYFNGLGSIEGFGYDVLNRVSANSYGGSSAITYSNSGNIIKRLVPSPYVGIGTLTYPTPGATAVHPHAVKNSTVLGDFLYDANGNLLSGAGRTVTWTSFDMPVTISNSAAFSSFTYGPEHQRTLQCKNAENCLDGNIVYASGQEVETRNGQKIVKTYWPMGLGFETDQPGIAGNAKLLWQHVDRLGSIVALTGDDGVLADTLSFDVWGKRRKVDGGQVKSNPTPDDLTGKFDSKGYTGHEMLDDFDLVHMNGRVYDPRIGRFLSPDPIVQDPSNGQNYNRYSYVLNNPTNLTDPTGFQANCVAPVGSNICSKGEYNFMAGASGIQGVREESKSESNQGKTNTTGTTVQSGKGDQNKGSANKPGFVDNFKNGFVQGVSDASQSRGHPDVTDGTADKSSTGYLLGIGVGNGFVAQAAFGGRMPAVEAIPQVVVSGTRPVQGESLIIENGWAGRVNYSSVASPANSGSGKDFTLRQKQEALALNRQANGGVVRSDRSGTVLTQPQKSQRGVTPDANEWQFDHVDPKSCGGTNCSSNLQILSRKENRDKSND